jgi:hypothetical protein
MCLRSKNSVCIHQRSGLFTFSKKVKIVVPYCAPYYSAYFNRKQNHLLLHLHLYYIVTNFWTQSRKVACLSLLHLLEKQRSNFQVTVPVIFSSLNMWRQLVKNLLYCG